MRLVWSSVGVLTNTCFLSQKVVCRFSARLSGSPSVPALAGYRSISSASKTFMGRLARLAGLFAPTITRYPPGKFFSKIVLPLIRLRLSTMPRRQGVSRSIGVSFSLLNPCPMSSVGCSTIMGLGL